MKGGLQSSCYFFTFLYDSESKRDARKAYEICAMGEGTETSFFPRLSLWQALSKPEVRDMSYAQICEKNSGFSAG